MADIPASPTEAGREHPAVLTTLADVLRDGGHERSASAKTAAVSRKRRAAPDFDRINNGGSPLMLWWLVCIWLASGPAIPVFWLLSRAIQALSDARSPAQSPSHAQR